MKQTGQHFSALDFYRFLAAFGVLALHFTQFARYDQDSGFGYAVGNFYLFVDFFFVLSGFVIAATYLEKIASAQGIFVFLRRRIARIYPLHFITLILYLLPAVAGVSKNPEKYRLSPITQQVLLIQSWPLNNGASLNFPAWSISVEWAMYLLFPLVAWMCRRAGILPLLAMIALGFAALQCILTFDLVTPPLWFNDLSVIRALPTFMIGVLIAKIYRSIPIAHGTALGLAAFLMSVALMTLHVSPYLVITMFSLSIFLTAADDGQASYRFFESRLSKMLGDSSYAIYMLHSIILTVLVQYVWPRLLNGDPPIWFGAIIGIATVVISSVTFQYCERPLKNLIAGRRRKTSELTGNYHISI